MILKNFLFVAILAKLLRNAMTLILASFNSLNSKRTTIDLILGQVLGRLCLCLFLCICLCWCFLFFCGRRNFHTHTHTFSFSLKKGIETKQSRVGITTNAFWILSRTKKGKWRKAGKAGKAVMRKMHLPLHHFLGCAFYETVIVI